MMMMMGDDDYDDDGYDDAGVDDDNDADVCDSDVQKVLGAHKVGEGEGTRGGREGGREVVFVGVVETCSS